MSRACERGTPVGVEINLQSPKRPVRTKAQTLIAVTSGFLLVVLIGVASANDVETSSPASPDVELVPAVVVAAGTDSIDLDAVAKLTTYGPLVQRGTAVQLDDGRIATVAHALIDARRASLGIEGAAEPFPLVSADGSELVSTTRLHDLSVVEGQVLSSAFVASTSPAILGEQVALAGFPADGRLTTTKGTIISRTSGVDYGIGRPDVYVISATAGPGWSGGPVVNAQGELIAIIVGVEQRSGVTLAVPIEHLP